MIGNVSWIYLVYGLQLCCSCTTLLGLTRGPGLPPRWVRLVWSAHLVTWRLFHKADLGVSISALHKHSQLAHIPVSKYGEMACKASGEPLCRLFCVDMVVIQWLLNGPYPSSRDWHLQNAKKGIAGHFGTHVKETLQSTLWVRLTSTGILNFAWPTARTLRCPTNVKQISVAEYGVHMGARVVRVHRELAHGCGSDDSE